MADHVKQRKEIPVNGLYSIDVTLMITCTTEYRRNKRRVWTFANIRVIKLFTPSFNKAYHRLALVNEKLNVKAKPGIKYSQARYIVQHIIINRIIST